MDAAAGIDRLLPWASGLGCVHLACNGHRKHVQKEVRLEKLALNILRRLCYIGKFIVFHTSKLQIPTGLERAKRAGSCRFGARVLMPSFGLRDQPKAGPDAGLSRLGYSGFDVLCEA